MVFPPLLRQHLQFTIQGAERVVKDLASFNAGRIVVLIAILYLALAIARFVAGVITFIYVYFIRPPKSLAFYGPWAVVTGATDGIGKAYAEELAKKGESKPVACISPLS